MDPMMLALLGGALLLASSKGQGAYGEGSAKYQLTAGNYRVRFKSAKPQTNSLADVWAIPHVLMAGTGMSTSFESMRVDDDPNFWWFTGLASYGGQPKVIDLLPNMTLERL